MPRSPVQRAVPRRALTLTAAALAVAATATPVQAAGPRVETVARGLEIPWDIAFLPHGGALVTERPGRVRRLTRHWRLLRLPVARVAVSAVGEGGLLGIAFDPAFAPNHFVYMYFTAATGMRLERRRWTGRRLPTARR